MQRNPASRFRTLAILTLAAGLASAAAADAPKPAAAPAIAPAAPMPSSDRITLARPVASLEIMAEPAKVWKKLTSAEGMAAFGVTGDKKKGLDKVGDHVQAAVAGDKGTVVVTHIAKDSEWRAAFEPAQGHYVCSLRFSLKAQGKNTLLTYADWYSDEKAADVEKNLKATEKSMQEGLARFKGLVEKASAAGD